MPVADSVNVDRELITESLKNYVYIGDFFKEQPSKIHNELIEMITEQIYIPPRVQVLDEDEISPEFPYVFIRAPSGTGKTQLPFSISTYPVLYFTTIETANLASSQGKKS